MSKRLTVAVIFGGRSGEHEVSLMSAGTVMESLDRDKYEVVPIGITKGGRWLVGGEPMRVLRTAAAERTAETVTAESGEGAPLIPPIGASEVGGYHIDVAFPVLHGTYGEDGTVQGLLELADIPYVGAGVLASAVGMDKAVMKDIFREHGIPVAEAVVVKRKQWQQAASLVVKAVERDIGYPCFVKPANLGSSVGISKVHSPEELPAALDQAAAYDRKVLVEKAVPGCREIEVSVLGNDDPIASVPGEIVPSNEFYDYDAKYVSEGSQLIIPAELPSETVRDLQRLAISAYQALDCAGMARVDSFVSGEDGRIYVNEINTIPGFTRISMYPKLWEATGIGLGELIDRLLALAIERHADKRSSRTSYR